MDNIERNALAETQRFYLEYGSYCNRFRAIPSLLDGLKPVHRRILWSAQGFPKDKLIKTATIAGDVTGHTHPHGSTSVEGAIVTLVRSGLMVESGNWGCSLMQELPPAAARYTKTGLTDTVREELFELKDYCQIVDSELGYPEPVNLIVQVPVALTIGYMGIGIGCSTKIPALDKQSLIDAYESNDFNKLKIASKNLQVVEADWEGLWTLGRGSIKYSYKVTKLWDEAKDVSTVTIEGSGEIFKPRISALFRKWQDEGLISISDESSDIIRIVINKVKFIRKISVDDIYDRALKCCSKTETYRLNVYDPIQNKVRQVGIKEWMKTCRSIYFKTHDKYIDDNVNSRIESIELLEKIPTIAPDIQAQMPDKEVMEKHQINKAQLKAFEDMPMRYFRTEVVNARIKSLRSQISEFESKKKNKTA